MSGLPIPSVLVTILVRNKAHTLPYFFKFFEDLDYPREKMTLWYVSSIHSIIVEIQCNLIFIGRIYAEDNQDKSVEIIRKWDSGRGLYNIEFHEISEIKDKVTESIEVTVDQKRMFKIMKRRQEALLRARGLKMDYIWVGQGV